MNAIGCWAGVLWVLLAGGPPSALPAAAASGAFDFFQGDWGCAGSPGEAPGQRLRWTSDADWAGTHFARLDPLPDLRRVFEGTWLPQPQEGRFVQVATFRQGTYCVLHSLGWRKDRWTWQGLCQPASGAAYTYRQRLQRVGPHQLIDLQEELQGNAWVQRRPPQAWCRLKNVADVKVKTNRRRVR
jgi:hypothetical protein